MKTIDTKEDFLKWATEINHGITLARKCDMQDIYAHSNRVTLDNLFIECKGDRRLIICSVNNCMAFEEVEHLLEVLAKAKVSEEYKILDEEYRKLDHAKEIFEECKKPIYRKIASLKRRAEYAEKQKENAFYRLETANNILKSANNLINNLKEKAQKFDTLKSLFN